MATLTCPSCGASMALRRSKFGLFYGCESYPDCTETHGAHQHSGEPLGVPADRETRQWRMKAHAMFDRLWQEGHMSRKNAYRFMRREMDMQAEDAHIARMSIEECRRLYGISLLFLEGTQQTYGEHYAELKRT